MRIIGLVGTTFSLYMPQASLLAGCDLLCHSNCCLVLHWLCHCPSGEPVHCWQNVWVFVTFWQWSHDIHVNILELLTARCQNCQWCLVVPRLFCLLAQQTGRCPLLDVPSHVRLDATADRPLSTTRCPFSCQAGCHSWQRKHSKHK